MKTADFLFPRELEISTLGSKKAIVIGSCLAEAYLSRLRRLNPSNHYDFILFNNAADLPPRSRDELRSYDYQYIQIPLRSVVTDAATRIVDFDRDFGRDTLLQIAKNNLVAMLDKALSYNRQSGLLTFVSTFFIPQHNGGASLSELNSDVDFRSVVSDLNRFISDYTRQETNCFVADIEMIASSIGKMYFLDDSIGFRTHGSLVYPDWGEGNRIEAVPPIASTYEIKAEEFFEAVSRQIDSLYRTVMQMDMVKVVIFDLDNTMWRGQLAEDYGTNNRPPIDGWPLGIWDAINQLRLRGIVVAIASKNDLAIVEDMWEQIVHPPFVRFDDFVVKKIDWKPKAENIREILQTLSLTAKSAVFVDDNPVERNAVKAALPDIRVTGADPFVVRRILLWSAETQVARLSDESVTRESMLKRQIERESERLVLSHDDFLKTLASQVQLWVVADTAHRSFGRVHELVNKTNQFNTNGERWSVEQFQDFLDHGGTVFAFSVKDRFTDYGTVGVVFAARNTIVQFIMSCRVLGMEIEQAVVSTLVERMRRGAPLPIQGSVVETKSNMPCRDLYLRLGFLPGQRGTFTLPAQQAVAAPAHVAVDGAALAGSDAVLQPT